MPVAAAASGPDRVIDRDFTLKDLALAHRVMGLPEPLVWVHRDHGIVVGMIEGWITGRICEIDHMVVLPLTPRKLTTMMTMSRECTAALHARGLDVVIKIAIDDERSGLRAWAKRQKYVPYGIDEKFEWYISRKDIPSDG